MLAVTVEESAVVFEEVFSNAQPRGGTMSKLVAVLIAMAMAAMAAPATAGWDGSNSCSNPKSDLRQADAGTGFKGVQCGGGK